MPLEIDGPDAQGSITLRFVPSRAAPDPSNAGQPYLEQDEKAIVAVIKSLIASMAQKPAPTLAALSVTAWTIDPVNGSDNAPSINGAMLRTARELCRRWGNGTLTTNVVVTQIGDLAEGDGWIVNGLSTGGNFDIVVTVNVVPTATQTIGAITANTPINHADPHDCAQYLTIASGGAGIAWAPYIDKQVRIVSGPRAGACAFPDTDMGSGRCRFSPFMVPEGQAVFLPIVSPQNGDVIELVTLGECHNLVLHYTDVVFVFNNAHFDDASGAGHDLEGLFGNRVQFNGCIVDGFMYVAMGLGPGCSGTEFTGNLYTVASQPFLWGCHCVGGGYAVEGNFDVDGDTLLRSSRLVIIGPTGGSNHMATVNNVGGYGNGVGALIECSQGGQLYVGNSSTSQGTNVYGQMDYNADAHTMSQIQYDDPSSWKVQTAISAFLQGGVPKTLGDLPLAPDAGLNAIVRAMH